MFPDSVLLDRRAEFVDLVSRGKVGLALEDEAQQLVAIDGQQPMMGGGPPGAAAAATAAPAVVTAIAAQHMQFGGIATDSSSGGTSGSGGSLGSAGRQQMLAEDSFGNEPAQSPGSVVAVRLMCFSRGWAAGTVAPVSGFS